MPARYAKRYGNGAQRHKDKPEDYEGFPQCDPLPCNVAALIGWLLRLVT
jgi:hypothetical protein